MLSDLKREAFHNLVVVVSIQMKKTSETRLSEDSMGGPGKDLVMRIVSESIRHQELLYGEVRELDDLKVVVVDDGN